MKEIIQIIVVFFALFSFSSCEFLDSVTQADCQNYVGLYNEALSREGQLAQNIPTEGAFSMAMVMSQDTVNKYFKAVSDFKLPQLGISGVATVELEFPRIELGGDDKCQDCFLLTVPLYVKVLGNKIGGKIGYSFKILAVTRGVDKTEVWANIGESNLHHAEISLGGSTFVSTEMVKKVVTEFVRITIGNRKLFEVAAWKVGNGDVRLLAGVPKINSRERTLMFGMYSNLITSLESSVNWEQEFPSDADLALHIHPELIRAMIGRMLSEGQIPRKVQLSGEGQSSSEEGSFEITLASMNATVSSLEHFNLGFRLWRVAGGFCGYADIMAGMSMSVSDKAFKFKAGTVKVLNSAGFGKVFEVLVNTLTSTEFFQKVMSFAEVTINYNELEVPVGGETKKAEMVAKDEHIKISIDGNGLNMYFRVGDIL